MKKRAAITIVAVFLLFGVMLALESAGITLVDVLWWDGSSLEFNKDFLDNASDQEKAVMAYLATKACTGCKTFIDRDIVSGGDAIRFGNLECELITLLGLDSQGGEEHVKYIKKWFVDDERINKRLKHCYMTPYTATGRVIYHYITLEEDGDTITAYYKMSYMFLQKEDYREWLGEDQYKVEKGKVRLIYEKIEELSESTIESGMEITKVGETERAEYD
ncbi:MAG: hypothetical protein PHH49_02740 [Candidatus Omnitrophica bacterium]|nr:hypothetical protein [Candidatus Omnitrophota bacterium]MDD5487866.1 hypothetical protein [Candidatus Omnitrophota bacterium]